MIRDEFLLKVSVLIFVCSSISYGAVVWERNVKLTGYGSIDTSHEAFNWRVGIEGYSNAKYGVKANWMTILRLRYEETIEKDVKSKGLDETILHLIYRNYLTRFFYWTAIVSHWTPVSNFADTIYNESSLSLGCVHTRRLTGEYGVEIDKLLKPDTPPTYWLKSSLVYFTPIGWRGRASMYTQLLPKLNIENISYYRVYFTLGYEYKFTDKVSVKFENLTWYDSKASGKVDSKGTIDIVFNIY